MPTRTQLSHSWWIAPAAILALLLATFGCGGREPEAGRFSHYHPAGWINTHPPTAVTDINDCTVCHEMTVLRQGSPAPSCMTTGCHHASQPDFKLAAVHGPRAKGRLGPTVGGLASCQTCHGTDALGAGTGVSCATCHGVAAPHPRKPWLSGASTHVDTAASNAAACSPCHFPGSAKNPPSHPATPAPAGTAPGCFNNTLCHGSAAPHLRGDVWLAPTTAQFHGLTAKQDLLFCQSCHGTLGTTAFNGGSAPTSCAAVCHSTAFAHPMPWVAGSLTGFPPYRASHRNSGNRPSACPVCHDYTLGRTAPVPAAPSCFTLTANGCHTAGHP